MDTVIERCAGIDIGKRSLAACIRMPGPGGRWRSEGRTFGTTTRQLLALRDWLGNQEVTRVGMESTGA